MVLGPNGMSVEDIDGEEIARAPANANSPRDSLFSDTSTPPASPSRSSPGPAPSHRPASRIPPRIPGLSFHPTLLSAELCSRVLDQVAQCNHLAGGQWDQAMLFGRVRDDAQGADTDAQVSANAKHTHAHEGQGSRSGLPPWADDLVSQLSELLHDRLDPHTYALLFPKAEHIANPLRTGDDSRPTKRVKVPAPSPPLTPIQPCRSRQLILNLYRPGQGITPHVDLLRRFGDGIILCSFGAQGIVMEFERVADPPASSSSDPGIATEVDKNWARNLRSSENTASKDAQSLEERNGERYALYLPPRSVLILSGEARYQWTHAIPARDRDVVLADDTQVDAPKTRTLLRGLRLSITIRWLLPGAEIVGAPDVAEQTDGGEEDTSPDGTGLKEEQDGDNSDGDDAG